MQLYEIVKECKNIRETFINSYEFDSLQGLYPVIGEGLIPSPIMIIARDLGGEEVLKGRPLIGKSGQILRSVLKYLDIDKKVFLTNLVPYKPNNNITFSFTIRKAFVPILSSLVELVNPKCIITLGKESAEEIIGFKNTFMKEIESFYLKNPFFIERKILNSDVICYTLPAVHPSFLIRKGISQNMKENLKSDLFMNYFFNPIKLAKLLIERSSYD